MIHAKELRIGNKATTLSTTGYQNPGIVTISTIGSRGVNQWSDMGASGEIRFEELEPIPLAPAILEKCGFEKSDSDSELFVLDAENIRFPIHFHYRGRNGFSLTDPHHTVLLSEPVKFIHQLQNLFYCLTGTELNVKL